MNDEVFAIRCKQRLNKVFIIILSARLRYLFSIVLNSIMRPLKKKKPAKSLAIDKSSVIVKLLLSVLALVHEKFPIESRVNQSQFCWQNDERTQTKKKNLNKLNKIEYDEVTWVC